MDRLIAEQRYGEPGLHQGFTDIGDDLGRRVTEMIEDAHHARIDVVTTQAPGRSTVAGDDEQVVSFIQRQAKAAGDRRHHTADDVLEGVGLTDRRAIVTGAGSGIGAETARALAAAGADVTMTVRNLDAGERLADELRSDLGTDAGALQVAHLDLADQGSVRTFASAWDGPLHTLVNNAGVMAPPTLTRSAEGWEAQFATNHLGHFALAQLLHGALASASGARIVSVASIGHLFSPVILDDLHYRFRPYDPWTSRTAGVAPYALDEDNAQRLWEPSVDLLNLSS
jgi:short chain dehydrogenase